MSQSYLKSTRVNHLEPVSTQNVKLMHIYGLSTMLPLGIVLQIQKDQHSMYVDTATVWPWHNLHILRLLLYFDSLFQT